MPLSRNLGALTSWNPLGLSRPVMGLFYLFKNGRGVRLTTYHHSVPLSRNLGALTSWNPLGLSRPVMGLLYLFKNGRGVRLTTLPPSCAVVTKSGSLNFLEPSGLVQACNGTALPLFALTGHSTFTGVQDAHKN